MLDEEEEKKKQRKRKVYKLSKAEAGVAVGLSMRQHYSVELNAKRNCNPFSQETLNKMEERVYCFLYFGRKHAKIDALTLGVLKDDRLISKFVDYLCKIRKLMPNTISTHLRWLDIVMLTNKDGMCQI